MTVDERRSLAAYELDLLRGEVAASQLRADQRRAIADGRRRRRITATIATLTLAPLVTAGLSRILGG